MSQDAFRSQIKACVCASARGVTFKARIKTHEEGKKKEKKRKEKKRKEILKLSGREEKPSSAGM